MLFILPQFESIHPFTDGNGRIGRALIGAVSRRRGLTKNTVTPIASAMVADVDTYFSLVNNYRSGDVDPFVLYLARFAPPMLRVNPSLRWTLCRLCGWSWPGRPPTQSPQTTR